VRAFFSGLDLPRVVSTLHKGSSGSTGKREGEGDSVKELHPRALPGEKLYEIENSGSYTACTRKKESERASEREGGRGRRIEAGLHV